MKKILVLFALIIIYNFSSNVDDCKSQWVQQYYGGDSIGLYAIQFVNNSTGYIVGGQTSFNNNAGVFLKTTNGGNNWVRINMNVVNDIWLYAISFVNENTGYVCGRSSNIRKTIDGGLTWTTSRAATNTLNFNAIHFLNDQTGYVGGRYGMLAKTTNGGDNWTPLDSAITHIDAIHFFDVNTGIMCDENSGIYRTTNGGLNWVYKYQTDSLGRRYAYISTCFLNNNTGYILGSTLYNGILMKTTNSGINWSEMGKFSGEELSSVFALSSSNIYIGGYMNYILFTTNSGNSWALQNLPSTASAYSVYFLNPNTGYSCGDNGAIFRTTNGGVRIENISTEIPSKYSLSQNYPNPFNPITNVKFSILKTEQVKLIVYDVMGREVQTLVNERLQPGTYEASFDGSALNSGVYFYTIKSEKFLETKRMLLIK